MTLRGESSLTHDNNTALFVIDGVPISSDMESSNSASQAFNTTAPIDYGNGASDLNPEDIESVSVLKGPRGDGPLRLARGNGAIVITTKSGRQTRLGHLVQLVSDLRKGRFLARLPERIRRRQRQQLEPRPAAQLQLLERSGGQCRGRHCPAPGASIRA